MFFDPASERGNPERQAKQVGHPQPLEASRAQVDQAYRWRDRFAQRGLRPRREHVDRPPPLGKRMGNGQEQTLATADLPTAH
jgi:hypothetical protein